MDSGRRFPSATVRAPTAPAVAVGRIIGPTGQLHNWRPHKTRRQATSWATIVAVLGGHGGPRRPAGGPRKPSPPRLSRRADAGSVAIVVVVVGVVGVETQQDNKIKFSLSLEFKLDYVVGKRQKFAIC